MPYRQYTNIAHTHAQNWKEGVRMSVFNKVHTLIDEKNTIGAFENETELQCQFVNLSLGQLCPVSIIYPTSTGEYKRVDTLRAQDFATCNYNGNSGSREDCNCLCVTIAKYLDLISSGESNSCLSEVLHRDSYDFLKAENYEYLTFTCPISKLVKFAFPIKFNKRLVCVVFVGQYSVISRHSIKYALSHTLSDYKKRKQFQSLSQLFNYVSDTILPEMMSFQYKVTKNFEEKEKEELNLSLSKAQRHLSRSMINVLNYNVDSDLEDFSTAVLKLFWMGVKDSYKDLFRELGAHNIILFIDDDFSESLKTSKFLFGIELFSILKRYPNDKNHLDIFNLAKASVLCEKMNSDTITSTMYLIREDFQKCFCNLLTESIYQYDYVFYKNETHLPYAILITHNNANRNLSDTIVKCIQKIASNIRFELSSVLTKLSEHATKAILRIYRHEIIHQVLALRTSINNLEPEENTYLSPEKLLNIYNDCSDCLSSLAFMTENIKLFTSRSNTTIYSIVHSCPFESIDIFKDVINKHIAMHRELRDSKNLWFEVTGRTENSHKFECQTRFFNLLLFNIISNAVKYAYRCTNIWFEYTLADTKHQTKILTIRDYGSEISSSNEIYRLYYRGPSVEHAETGSGIGLFISKRISEIMGVKLYHQCSHISDYNVPLLERYLEIYDEYEGIYKSTAPTPECIMNEIARLQMIKKYNHIVNKNLPQDENKLCNDEVVSRITKPTYEVSFIIEL